MRSPEFAEAMACGDKRVGQCPFCAEPGWITGDQDWCIHYAGTFDTLGDMAPCYPFLQQEPFRRFYTAIMHIAGMALAERTLLLDGCSAKSRQVVTAALTYPEPLDFWRDFLPHELLFVEVGKEQRATTYISLFVADLGRGKEWLATTVWQVLREIGLD